MSKAKVVLVLTMAVVAGGCAMWSENSRPALLAGDADIALFQTRTSKNVSKLSEADGSTNGGGSTAAPTGGGTITLDPSQLMGLVKATVEASRSAQPKDEIQPRSAVVYYTVVRGDNLWDISRKYGTTVEALKRANGIRGTMIRPGQMLRIPQGK